MAMETKREAKIVGACEWVDSMIASAGGTGFSLVAKRDRGPREFYLWANAVSAEDLEKINVVFSSREHGGPAFQREPTMQYHARMLIRFCPHCGLDLSAIIKRDPDGYDAILRLHSSIDI